MRRIALALALSFAAAPSAFACGMYIPENDKALAQVLDEIDQTPSQAAPQKQDIKAANAANDTAKQEATPVAPPTTEPAPSTAPVIATVVTPAPQS